jgi:peptidoglycan L-alanyl-D-glutamate endopeptidase CwlK
MPSYSQSSKDKLSTCHQDLQVLFNEVIKYFDCTILDGHRGRERQNKAYTEGFSKVQWPDSKHNKVPSMAVDAVPYPIDWDDVNRMRFFAGWVLGIASQLKEQGKIESDIISGFDWDGDTELKDTRFQDAPHFQINT